MYKELHRLVESASALGAARLAESLGITPGEISQRQALKTADAAQATLLNR